MPWKLPVLGQRDKVGQRKHQRRNHTGVRGVNYGRRWRIAREAYLQQHPFCAMCPADGFTVATELDHIVPHLNDYDLFWDESNWQGLCKRHHSQKTAREVGFGGSY